MRQSERSFRENLLLLLVLLRNSLASFTPEKNRRQHQAGAKLNSRNQTTSRSRLHYNVSMLMEMCVLLCECDKEYRKKI